MQRRDRFAMTGVFHPRGVKQDKFSHTGVFHPGVSDGVGYIPPADEVSVSQILEASDLPVLQDPMSLIDEVLISVMKTERHEMVFDESLLPSDTHPSLMFGEEPSVGHSVEELEARPNPRWLVAPSDSGVHHPNHTLALCSTRRAVAIPEPSQKRTTAQLRAWTQGGSTAVALEGAAPSSREELSPSQGEVSINAVVVSSQAPLEMKAVEPEAEEHQVSEREIAGSWRDFSYNPVTLYQKISIALLALILVVEVVRLLMSP